MIREASVKARAWRGPSMRADTETRATSATVPRRRRPARKRFMADSFTQGDRRCGVSLAPSLMTRERARKRLTKSPAACPGPPVAGSLATVASLTMESTVENNPHVETIQVVIEGELLAATDRAARRLNVNRSAFIRQAVREH